MSIWVILLIVLVVLALGGSGYGYYREGPYASPLAIIGALLLIALVLWLIFGGGITLTPPSEAPRIEVTPP